MKRLTELRETLIFPSLLKDMANDSGEQPEEEINRARSGRVLRAKASVPVELGDVTLWCVDILAYLEAGRTLGFGILFFF